MNKIRNEISKMVYENSRSKYLKILNTINDNKRNREFWNIIRYSDNKFQRNRNNELDDMKAIEFYSELFGIKNNIEFDDLIVYDKLDDCVVDDISDNELYCQLSNYINNKHIDNDEIMIEMIRYGIDEYIHILKRLFNRILNNGIAPKYWRNDILKLIYKKGDRKDPSNYRPMIISHIGKLLFKIILERIRDDIESLLVDDQYGFRKNRDTVKQLKNLNILIQEHRFKYGISLDIRKAYDSVDRSILLKILKYINLNEKYMKILENYYLPGYVLYKNKRINVCIRVKQ